MRTVKQVSELTGISVRTLQYYDEIGLFKPSEVNSSGYRMYDDDALEVLQQILFFKELDFTLKEIKMIMQNPEYDKIHAFQSQQKLIQAKRDRLNSLLNLLDKLVKGEKCMSFKEFDMSDYFHTLEEYKNDHADEIKKYWGSMDKFNEFVENAKSKETEIAKMAIKEFGSIEKYTEAMKKNLANTPAIMEGFDTLKSNLEYYQNKSEKLMQTLTSDLSKDPTCEEIQKFVKEMDDMAKETFQIIKMNMGENYWGLMADLYLSNAKYIEVTDKKYGVGASEFIGKALKAYAE
jgi:DNA-binding transcriptional MerR regulator